MANIYTLKSGVASDTTVWSGGVVPASGDRVLICTGHTVTVDGTYTWGDDSTSTVTINSVSTTTSIFVNGTLKASRTANSQLTCRGECQMATGGTLDYGTEADPIPAAYTAVILVNDSASQAHGKYGLSTSTTLAYAGFRMWGAEKTPRTTMTAALSTDTTVTVADATGWAIGDVLIFGISTAEGGLNSYRYRAITGVSGNSITIGANLGYASQEGRTVMNLTRNVRVRGVNGNTYRSFVSLYAYSNVAAFWAADWASKNSPAFCLKTRQHPAQTAGHDTNHHPRRYRCALVQHPAKNATRASRWRQRCTAGRS